MSEREKGSGQEIALRHLMERAQRDSVFRAEFMDDPKGVIERELDMELPPDADVRVLEEAPNQIHLILPARGELSDEALSQVAGGISYLRTFRSTLFTGPSSFIS